MSTWTTPITWAASSTVTAAQMNTEIRDHANWLKGAFTQMNVTSDTAKAKITPALVGARAYKAANQSVTTATETGVQLDSERFDSDAFHDTATNNTRMTIPTSYGGYYIFGGALSFASNATGVRAFIVRLNGTTDLARELMAAVSGFATQSTPNGLYSLAAADYIELIVYQSSGGNLNLEALNNTSPEFWIHRLSST